MTDENENESESEKDKPAESPASKAGKAATVDTSRVLDEMARKNQAGGGKKPRQTKGKSAGGNRLGIALLLLMFPLIGALVFLAYQQRELQATLGGLNQDNEQLRAQLSQREADAAALRAELITALRAEVQAELDLALNQLNQVQQQETTDVAEVRAELQRALASEASNRQAEIANLQQQLSQRISNVATAPSPENRDWKLSEALHLLGLAGRKLALEQDRNTAIELMGLADQALADSENPGVFNVRQALADELGALRAAQTSDRSELHSRLSALSARVANLTIVDRSSQRIAVAELQPGSGWWQASMDFLSSVFVWREVDGGAVLSLGPSEQLALREQTRLALQQAQLALLSLDAPRYRAALDSADSLLENWLNQQDDAVMELRQELGELQSAAIAPDLPQPQQSVELLRRLIASAGQP